MKRINIKSLVVSFFLVALLSLSVGCNLPNVTLPPAPTETPTLEPTPGPPATPINPTWTPPQPPSATTPILSLPSIADVVALVKPSVVAINTEVTSLDFFNRPFTQQGAGSGWIIDKDGIIVTNNHVVEGAKTISVTLDNGSTYTVDSKSVFTDPFNDLAILRINAQNLSPLKIGDSSKMRVGDWLVAIGNSLGRGISAKEGIVSRQGVSVAVDQGQTLYDLLETSAAINPGNSGGPLVNMAGEVIGITSAKIATIGVEGMGYAISTQTAMPIIQQLIKNGYVVRPWLGVTLYTVDQFAIIRYRLTVDKGVLVTEVVKNSPAGKAGLAAGDVIVSAGGKEVATAEEMVQIIRTSQIGQGIEITYWRGNSKNTVVVVPIESPRPT